MRACASLPRRLAVSVLVAGLLAGCGATPQSRRAETSGPSRVAGSAPVTVITPPATTGARSSADPAPPFRELHTTYPSPALHARRAVVVLLPAGYATSQQKYPVIVLLHGDPGSPDALIRLGHLLSAFASPTHGPFIGVLPDGNGPVVTKGWYLNLPQQQLGTSVAVDLRRWVDRTFRTDGRYSYAGLSSGAFGAAYLPLLDPEPVQATCGLSGWYDGWAAPIKSDTAAQRAASATLHLRQEPPFTFLAYGRSDYHTRGETLAYAAALRRAHKRFVLQTYPGGHDWHVWTAAFLRCMQLVVPPG